MAIVSGATFWGGEGIINFQISYIVNGVPYLKIDGNIVRIGDWASAIYGGSTPASPGTHNVCVYDNNTGESLYCANIVVQETIAPPPPPPPPPPPCEIVYAKFLTKKSDPGYEVADNTIYFEINYNCAGIPYLLLDGTPVQIGSYHGYGTYTGTIPASVGSHQICVYDNITGTSSKCTTVIVPSPSCVPNWQCEPGQTGFEIDGCGNRRANPACVYREAVLASCQWPLEAIAGQAANVTITVNQGSLIENYKLVFSGDFAGESTPFIVDAGAGQQQFTIGNLIFTTGGTKNVSATLIKV